MDIISDQFTEETVTDIDFVFEGGTTLPLTFREGDTLTRDNERGTLVASRDNGRMQIEIDPSKLLYTMKSVRTLRVPVKAPGAPRPEAATTPPSVGNLSVPPPAPWDAS